MNTDITVHTWAELQEALFHDSFDERLGRFRSAYVYRGLSDVAYTLKTSLMRLGGNFEALEGHLLRNFKKYARRDLYTQQNNSVWNWLALAQHYGLPTRLLDWTYSPYVALHFATAEMNKYDTDGVIWCVNYVKTNELLPHRLKYLLLDEGSNIFTAEMLQNACHTIKDFDTLQRNLFVVFLEPPSLDERIVNQYALFSLMSNPATMLDEWLQQHSSLFFRIIIPAALKWEIRDKLDQANITERVLFPGLDGLSTWLRRHYSPKGQTG
ncbi:MAG TPA: FRG domain-containing protein [Chitinophagales bacterium]|nr:FRG domain-containing protein [Chitinophagales bacterium]HRK28879.1 FRG domain-containing protein [Chitinophagales bacterium]